MEYLEKNLNIYKELLEVVLEGKEACLSTKFNNKQGSMVETKKVL